MIFLSTQIIFVHQFSASAEREGLFAPAGPPHHPLMIPLCSVYDLFFNRTIFLFFRSAHLRRERDYSLPQGHLTTRS